MNRTPYKLSMFDDFLKLNFFKKTGLVGGCFIIILAFITYAWRLNLADVAVWLSESFGWLFLVTYASLTSLGLIAVNRIKTGHRISFWVEVGQQSASCISTLALTFTLLGISLGISVLSETTLTPDNVGGVIQMLTKHFSKAFMTTVIGLPTAQILRSILLIQLAAKNSIKEAAL